MLFGFPTTIPEIIPILVNSLITTVCLMIASKILFSNLSVGNALKFAIVANVVSFLVFNWIMLIKIILVTVNLFVIRITTFTVIDLVIWIGLAKLIKEVEMTDVVIGFILFYILTANTIFSVSSFILSLIPF